MSTKTLEINWNVRWRLERALFSIGRAPLSHVGEGVCAIAASIKRAASVVKPVEYGGQRPERARERERGREQGRAKDEEARLVVRLLFGR